MKKSNVIKGITLLILMFPFHISCKGQRQSKAIKNIVAGSRPAILQQPKLIRTHGIECANVKCHLQDRAGNIWFNIDGEGAYKYDGHEFKNLTTNDGLSSNYISTIIQHKNGKILFGTSKGMCSYDGTKFSKFPETDTLSITCLLEDRDGIIWLAANGSIYSYNGGKLKNYLNNKDYHFNLGNHGQLIQDIIQDRKGDLWFSSWNGGGVWRYDGKSFTNYLPSAEYYNTGQDERVRGYSSMQNDFAYWPAVPLQNDHITDDMIFCITEDKSGDIWFATRRHGACKYNGKSFTTVGLKDGFVNYGVYSIYQDKKGILWFTTDANGIFRYNGKTFKNFTTKDGLVNNSVLSVLEDNNGNLWFGTKWFGLSRFDGKSFTNFSGAEFQ